MKKIVFLIAFAVLGVIFHNDALQVLQNFSTESERSLTPAENTHSKQTHQAERTSPKQTVQNPLNTTLALIQRGGPFPYSRDGIVFENREKLLPLKPRGYYREYTVPTPGLNHRGARRVVTGGDPPEVYYYTEDHYRSFRKISGS